MVRPPSSDSQYTSIVFLSCFFWNAVLGWGPGSIVTAAASNIVDTENVIFIECICVSTLLTSHYKHSGYLSEKTCNVFAVYIFNLPRFTGSHFYSKFKIIAMIHKRNKSWSCIYIHVVMVWRREGADIVFMVSSPPSKPGLTEMKAEELAV